MTTKNIEAVQSVYAAFGRGDVPAILTVLAEDVAWEYQPCSTDVPWLQPRNGRGSVPGFFEALMKELDIKRFEPTHVIGSGNLVIALAQFEGVVRRTGKSIVEVDEPHVWHFNDAGKVVRFRHCTDTHAHWLAWQR